jgi:hypothetical protein
MDPAETCSHASLARPRSEADGSVTEIVGLLRQAATALDRMWHDALLGAAPNAVISLGEASHSAHRALLALSQPDRFEASVEVGRDDIKPSHLLA